MVCLSQNLSHYKESIEHFFRQTCRTLSVVFSLVYDIQTCVTRLTFRGNHENLNNTQNRMVEMYTVTSSYEATLADLEDLWKIRKDSSFLLSVRES